MTLLGRGLLFKTRLDGIDPRHMDEFKAPKGTPIVDGLRKQKPPEGATVQQWKEYCNKVADAEKTGMKNPEFVVDKPWEKKSHGRF